MLNVLARRSRYRLEQHFGSDGSSNRRFGAQTANRQSRLKLVPKPALPYTLFYVYPIESFIMQVSKWGNSLAVRLPVSLVQELGIADGDELVLQPAPRQASQPASVSVTRLPSKLERLQAVRHLRGSWGADFAFDRDEANAR